MSARGVRLAAAGAAVAGVVALVFGRVPLGYDSYFALVWGRALAHGRSPDLDPAFASTPHPLFNALATALDWLPGSPDDLLRAVVLLSLGALCAGVFELGRGLAGWPVGLLAAARALAGASEDDDGELLPDPLDTSVHERVAEAVREAASGS